MNSSIHSRIMLISFNSVISYIDSSINVFTINYRELAVDKVNNEIS